MKPLLFATLAAAALATAACGSKSAATPQVTAPATSTLSASASAASLTPQPAVTPSPSPTTSAQASGCLSRYLHGATGLGQGAAGSTYVVITFKNLNNVPCTLYGFPGVAQAAGTPVTDVGKPSVEDSSTTRELVTLQPGGYAYATLRVVEAGNFPASVCTQENTTWLAVIPPNQTVPLYIPFKSVACKGTAQVLTVTAVRPGNGG